MNDFAKMEIEGWSDAQVAQHYADNFAFAAAHSVATMVGAVNAGPGAEVLDLCCGQGILSQGLTASGASATGLDFSEAMLDMARARVPGAKFVQGDAMNLRFPDASFDAATMGFGILHVPDAAGAVAEAHRVLKPGGKFAYSCWHGAERFGVFPIIFKAIHDFGEVPADLPTSFPPTHFAQPENAEPLLTGASFVDVTYQTVESYWICTNPSDPVDFFKLGTVRGAALLKTQTPERLTQIEDAVAEWVKANTETTKEGAWKVPLPSNVISATKKG